MRQYIFLILVASASATLSGMEKRSCENEEIYQQEECCVACLLPLNEAYEESALIKVNGSRKLRNCEHSFHQRCLVLWYLSKWHHPDLAKATEHKKCPCCKNLFGKPLIKSIEKRLSRKVGPYKDVKQIMKAKHEEAKKEKLQEQEQQALFLLRESERVATDGDEDLARQMQEEWDQENNESSSNEDNTGSNDSEDLDS